jgi:hypothetical protein
MRLRRAKPVRLPSIQRRSAQHLSVPLTRPRNALHRSGQPRNAPLMRRRNGRPLSMQLHHNGLHRSMSPQRVPRPRRTLPLLTASILDRLAPLIAA